ncbi:MAG: hypothetical protein WC617_20130 [Rhodanobacter sp.]
MSDACGHRVVKRGRAGWLALGGLLLVASTAPIHAQMAARLSGQVALDEIKAASAALAAQTKGAADAPMAGVEQQLADMAGTLQALHGDLDKPVETINDAERAGVLRAHAAAARVQAYVAASEGCQGGDAGAMQASLAEGVARLARDTTSAKLVPVVDGVETLAHVPLFVLHQGSGPMVFALTGINLVDTQCANPKVVATDAAGRALSSQPDLTGAAPSRIELRWPQSAALPTGSVVLHVTTQRKAFLVGCTAMPEASAVIQVAPAVRYQVAYALSARCPASTSKGSSASEVALAHGKMPWLAGYGSTVSQPVDTSACAEPESYSVSAIVEGSDGSHAAAGPFTQSAQASITAGLPGGLTLSWNPSAQTLFARSGLKSCKGAY